MPNKINVTSKSESLLKFYLPLAVLTFCFFGLYYHVIAHMVKDWSTNDNYSHGFLVPLISGYLIWHNRHNLSKAPLRPSNAGLFVLGAGLCLFLVANVGAELFTMRFSILVVLLGLGVYLAGRKLGKALLLPIAYLIFMIPLPGIIWNKIAFPLKLFATNLSANAISILGISVYREGNIIHLANMSLEVVDACSGLRSLTSLLALSAAFAIIACHSKKQKWALFLSAIPIAILVNIIRLTITAVLAKHYGTEVADGFLHELSGVLVFVLAFVFLYLVYLALDRFQQT